MCYHVKKNSVPNQKDGCSTKVLVLCCIAVYGHTADLSFTPIQALMKVDLTSNSTIKRLFLHKRKAYGFSQVCIESMFSLATTTD